MSPAALTLGLLTLLACAWRGWTRRRDGPLERLAEAVLPALLAGLVFVYHESLQLGVRWVWSACRLAPAVGWWHGWPLYSPAGDGPVNGWLYGPVAAVFWSPAALAARPQAALTIAMSINLVVLLLPLLVAGSRGGLGAGKPGLLAFAFGAAVFVQVYPGWYMASSLNVDAVAAGLGAASCLVLLGGRGPIGSRHLLLAAGLAVLAAWTKQIETPLCLAQAGWLWIRRDRATAGRYLAACAAGHLLMLGVVCAALQPHDVFFNMWTIPAAHVLLGGWPAAGVEMTEFCRYAAVLWLPAVAAVLFTRDAVPEASAPEPAGRDGLLLFLAAAVVLLPSGIMAVIKIGGDRNSIHSLYYLAAAAIVALRLGWSRLARVPVPAARVAVLLAAAVAVSLAARQVAGYPGQPLLPRRCLSEEAWQFAREHPGRVYFPWDPLATLLAGGRMHHFEYGVIDRDHAGRPLDPAHVAGGLPAPLDFVVYPRADYPQTMRRRHLPQFSVEQATADWLIYRKPDGNK